MHSTFDPIHVRSQQNDYAVEFVDTLDRLFEMAKVIPDCVAIADRRVAELYRSPLADLSRLMPVMLLDAREDGKTLAGVNNVVDFLQLHNCRRNSHILAIGGGVIQDIATFAAHIYYRGIRWTYIPTTLLAMSDSCIGSKCGINHKSFKNQLGAFHSPSRVLVCTDFVKTLSDRDVASGYGEILKLMLIGSEEHMIELCRVTTEDGLRTPTLLNIIRKSLEVKKVIIELDEYDNNVRRTLNFGHTFGHALEAVTSNQVPHGLAVGWGVDLANFVSMRLGFLDLKHFQCVHAFIQKYLQFRLIKPIDVTALLGAVQRDKKFLNGRIDLIVMERPGALQIISMPLDSSVETVVAEYLERYNVLSGD